jgi:hypothetical protein
MFTKSFNSPRTLATYVLTALLFCVSFCKGAAAQATAPLVTASYAQTLTPPSGLGTVEQTVLDSYGDWLVLDYPNGALYEYPAGGGAMITLAPPGTLGGIAGYDSDGLTLDSMNNLYVDGNFNNCLVMFPYDTTTKTWTGLSTLTSANSGPDQCGTAPYGFAQYGLITPVAPVTNNYFQPWGLATLPNNVLVIADQNQKFIFTVPVTYPGNATCSSGNCSPTAAPGPATLILLSMTKRANSVAADKFGNIYFVEDSGGLSGAYMIPAGQTNVPSDTSSAIVRVDPSLPSVTAVTTDIYGNVYISDSTEGVFLVPNPSGTPNTAAATLLTSVPATGQVSVDSTRGILYIPTTSSGLTKVAFNVAKLGSTATGAPAATTSTALFSFSGAATPGSFVVQEAGTPTPDFAVASGGTCAAGTAYAAEASCTVNVALGPHAAGAVSAKLEMLDGSGNVLASITLQGTGTGSALQVSPAAESVIGAGLKTPSQVAVDANDNTFLADSGLGAVEMYPKGYGALAAVATVGTGLTAPTGVAVDGAGDVFIADSGNIYEVPIGPNGLIAASQLTLRGGLGTNLKLATNGIDGLYIADPDDHQVVKLSGVGGTFGLLTQVETDLGGFNAPSALAVDETGDLYVADGSNLYEITPTGTQSTLLTTLSNATGLAVDPSGAVYVTMPGGTVRIPNESGTLNPADQTIIASTVTSPTSVAIDSNEDIYIADSVGEGVAFVSADASVNLGTLSSATATSTANFSLVNDGNAPFNFTGFSSTADFSVTSTSCVGPEGVGATCSGTITFNPGPGDQGTLSAQIQAQTGAANSPVGINVVGVGVSLANSTTTLSVTNATVDGAPAVITVAPASGKGAAPTGQVTLTITGSNLTAPAVLTGTLANGTITLAPPQLPSGSYTFSVSYQGDRAYGTSTAAAQVTVAPGAVILTQGPLTPAQALVEIGGTYYVLAGGTGAQEPYDGSVSQYDYTYPVSIAATDGVPLVGQPVLNPKGVVVGVNYGTVTYQGAPAPGCEPVPVASNGTASFSAQCFTINTSNNSIPDLETTYTITPVYSPVGTGSTFCNPNCITNPNYTTVTGTPITLTALRNPVVQITSSPGSLSVSPGSTVTSTLTLTSVLGYGVAGAGSLLNNYSLPVQLACDGLPAYATCSFSYPTPDPTDAQSVDVGPAAGTVLSFMGGAAAPCTAAAPGAAGGCFGPGTVMMTINTNLPSGVATNNHAQSKVIFAAMFGFGLLGFAFSRKKKSVRGSLPMLVCLLFCSGIMASISGCSTKQLGTTTGNATPAGTYMVTVTAKQVGSQTITANPGITYGNSNQMSLPFTMNVTIQ